MARLIETDTLSNQNISAALAVGAYTADATRLVYVRLVVNQVAGGGDYIAYVTVTFSGVEYRVIPITTAAAAAGLTSICFVSVGIPVDSGDVITVYIDGLAGDTTTPDTQVRFYEADYLRPATADRTLAVDADGNAAADVIEWKSAAAPAMTGDAYAAIPTAQNIRDALKLAPTVGTPADGSVDAHLDAMPTLSDLGTADELVDAIYEEPTSGHTTAGSGGKALADAATGANHITADYGATEKAAIDLLDDAVGGLLDVHADVAAVHAKTTNLPSDPADESLVQAAIAAVKGDTAAILADTGTDGVVVSTHTTAAKAELQNEAEDALEAYDLDHVVQVTAGAEEPTDGSYLDQIMHKSAAQGFDATTDSLEALTDRIVSAGVSVVAAVEAGDVTVYSYATWEIPLTGLGDISSRSKLYFGVKAAPDEDVDNSSMVLIEETAGLLRFNGAAPSSSALGSLTVVNETTGAVTAKVSKTLTGIAAREGLIWEVVRIAPTSGDKVVVARDEFAIKAGVVRALT